MAKEKSYASDPIWNWSDLSGSRQDQDRLSGIYHHFFSNAPRRVPQVRVLKTPIADHGTPDGTPDATRTGHLKPVIDFLKDLGFIPLVDHFVFDKSGYGQYMFSYRMKPDSSFFQVMEYVMTAKHDDMGKRDVDSFISSLLSGKFSLPATIEFSKDGSVYDDANALQIGFTTLPEHPMLRKK